MIERIECIEVDVDSTAWTKKDTAILRVSLLLAILAGAFVLYLIW